jgi:hypothetical protein
VRSAEIKKSSASAWICDVPLSVEMATALLGSSKIKIRLRSGYRVGLSLPREETAPGIEALQITKDRNELYPVLEHRC